MSLMTPGLVLAQDGSASRPSSLPQPPASTDNDEITSRLRKMEEANARLMRQFEQLSKRNEDLSRQNKELSRENRKLSQDVQNISQAVEGLKRQRVQDIESQAEEKRKAAELTGAAEIEPEEEPLRAGETGGGAYRGGRAQVVGNRNLGRIKINTRYNYNNEGLQFSTDNEEFLVKLRLMFQSEWRQYEQINQDPVSSGFYMPRSRFYFTGRLTKPIEYNLSFQQGYTSFGVLNAYANFNYDPRFQFRIGRFKVPFIYERYKLHAWQLIAPERSLFTVNFQGGRQVGGMSHGHLFENRLEYGVGIFDGPRRSIQDYNSAKNVVAMLNFTPFENQPDSFLRGLNFGGSVDSGDQNNPLTPAVLRTSVNASNQELSSPSAVNNAVVPFLAFNQGVKEKGLRALWELHLAYYYQGLSLLAAWDSGFDSYARSAAARPQRVPIDGWFVQAAYILTGETLIDRVVIDPLRPFDLRKGKFGLGAWELTARYSDLSLGDEVFTAGLADPNLWTNRVGMVDLGANWYLNRWMKVYFDWEHAMFGQPVYYRPGPGLQKTSDLFWLRMQIFY